jgi:hypothetical protein
MNQKLRYAKQHPYAYEGYAVVRVVFSYESDWKLRCLCFSRYYSIVLGRKRHTAFTVNDILL